MVVEKDIFNNYLKEIGERVKKYRKMKHLSLEKLGLEVGLTRMHIHRIEEGYNITIKTLLKLAIALEVSTEKLIKTKHKLRKEDLEKLVNVSKSATQKTRKKS